MKTQYKHIEFIELNNHNGWKCQSRKGEFLLGIVAVYQPWKQYCFFPSIQDTTVHSSTCLDDIADFLRQLNGGDKSKE